MILCEVNKNSLKVRTSELLTAGSREVNEVEFRFNSVWDGVTKTAVFRTEKKTVSVLLDGDKTQLPWEVLADAGEVVAVGVYGVSGETLVLPTVWGIIGKVVDAAKLGDEEKEPTPDVYQQILDKLNSMSWDTLENKPFTSIGSGLKVEDGTLTATAQGGADITITDTAEVGEVLTVEEVDSEGKPTKWKTEKPTAEQKQADWSQNDETAKSYVKNRPGGYTKIEPTITGKYTGTELNMGEFTLTVGKEYIVKIDDKEYTATCYRSQTGRYDYSYVLGDYNCSSVPFYLHIDTSNSLNEEQTGDLLAKLSSDITNATITVLENITHQFDIKYIPDIPAEKIFPNPVGAFENIGTISLASATEQTISLSKYDYRIITGFGKVVASTSPSQLIYNRVYNEPPTGGDLRFSHYTNIAFVAFNIGGGLFSMFLMRYVGSTTTTPERSIGDIFFFPYRTYLSFKDITGNKLPATSIRLYGMN